MTWTRELDEATVLATRRGYWHVVLFYLLCGLAAIPTSFLVFDQVFTNATPDHWCSPPQELEHLGLSEESLRLLTIPGRSGCYDKCSAYDIDTNELRSVLRSFVVERTVTVKQDEVLRIKKILQLPPVSNETFRRHIVNNITEAVLSIRKNTTSPCKNGWIFNKEQYKRTFVTQFFLVCDDEWLPRLSNTLFWVGSIFGNFFFGWMSDRYGRRPTILLMIFLEVPLPIAAAFTTSYWANIGLNLLSGSFFPALYQQPFILALELMPPGQRNYTGIAVGMLFAGGMCLLAVLAYAVQDSYHLSLVTSLPFISLYGFFWILPESPRWYVARGRIADAEKVLRNLASKNGINLPKGFLLNIHKTVKEEDAQEEAAAFTNLNGHVSGYKGIPAKYDDDATKLDLLYQPKANQTQTEYEIPSSTVRRKSLQLINKLFTAEHTDEEIIENKIMDDQNSEGDCKASLLDIFRYPNIRKKFLLLTFQWVILAVVYNSLSYNTSNLGVNDYLAFFIGGAVEIPSYFLAWRCMERYGRRWVLSVFTCVGGIACLSCTLVPESMPWVTVSISMLGRLFAASSFAVFYVIIGEILPTVLRAQAMGASSFIAGIGLLTVPYIVHLAVYARALPLAIMGVLSVVGGFTALFLPETLNQPLPQTLGDGEMFGRDFNVWSCTQRQSESS